MPRSLRQPLKDHAVVCRFDVEAISLWYNHYTVIRSSVQTFSGHRPDVFGCQKTTRHPSKSYECVVDEERDLTSYRTPGASQSTGKKQVRRRTIR